MGRGGWPSARAGHCVGARVACGRWIVVTEERARDAIGKWGARGCLREEGVAARVGSDRGVGGP